MLISSISGTGQVSTSNQVDIKPKVSGDLTAVNVVAGQEVKKDDIIAKIDSRDALMSYNEAKASLENAKLELDELLAPVDEYDLMQAENSLTDTKDALTKLEFNQEQDYQVALKNIVDTEAELTDAYEDAYNEIADTFLDFPDILTELNTVLFSEEIADSEATVQNISNNDALINSFTVNDYSEELKFETYVDNAENNYRSANESYELNFDNYRDASRYSEKSIIENLLTETINTSKKVSDALKSEMNMLDFWVEYRADKGLAIYSTVSQYQSSLGTYSSQNNNHLSSLLAAERGLDDAKESIEDAKTTLIELDQNQPLDLAAAQRSVEEKEMQLADLLSGATTLEIKNKQLSVQQKQNSLTAAALNLTDYSIKAPFDGLVASVDASVGDAVGSVAIATLISKQNIAEITLNEIDVAKVKVGQKATLEFDAVTDLSVSGEVVEVDTIGALDQGVVSYGVKIAFDVQDERIKSGMSTSVNIIIESRADVLLVPIGAVKNSVGNSYVEIMVNGQPQKQEVSIGSSSDTMIEITSGLEVGQEVITQTISNGSGTSASEASNSSKSSSPGGSGMEGMFRAF